ncbi:hypothetical protein [Azospirillum argentinense]|uniref:hypothetical protein n=1 Tax=Azospirillum argentinense TaxID=2970906 RepID=UPI00190D4DF2|nr:hypothetical protein [Azospirillum argentinense]
MRFIRGLFGKKPEVQLKPMKRSSDVPLPPVRTIVVDGKRRTIVRDDVYQDAIRLMHDDRAA